MSACFPLKATVKSLGLMSFSIASFLEYLTQERRLSRRSIEAYCYAIKTYLAYLYEHGLKPDQVGPTIVRAYLEQREQQGLGPGGIHQAILSLRHYCRFLRESGRISDDPTIGITLPKLHPKLPEPLSREETIRLLEIPKGSRFVHVRNKAILEILYATGLRISELAGLRTDQMDLRGGTLRVRGKGGRERIVPFGHRVGKVVRSYLVTRKKRFPKATGPIFLSVRGGPLRRTHLWRQIKDYAQQAGIKRRVSPHVIRHSFATHMLSGGADLRSIQTMLGHRRITTTEIYTHVEPEHLRRVWDRAHPLS